jgi:UDP-glucose 4-epimerase
MAEYPQKTSLKVQMRGIHFGSQITHLEVSTKTNHPLNRTLVNINEKKLSVDGEEKKTPLVSVIDRYAMMYHRNEGLPVIVVRPGNAYGEDQRTGTGQGFLAAAIHAILNGDEIQIYGEQGTIRDYVHVSDVASGILAAFENGHDGRIYNIGTGIGTSNMEVLSILSDFAKRDGFPVRMRILPARQFDVEANVLDSSRLKNEAGWLHKIALKEGIRRIWEHANKSR